jgi:hypothetical protein
MQTPHSAPAQPFNPVGKSFGQRLDAFLADVCSRHGLTIRQDSGRTPEWQQRLHLCHMFLYNKYTSTMPAKAEPGKRTIAWTHLSDSTVTWALVPFSDILRTKLNVVPLKDGTRWKRGSEPDRAATEKRAVELLVAAGIGGFGKAMVSSGLSPCGEPCRCAAGRSKHLDGMAALKTAKTGTIDDYLKQFGLHRPLLNHPESPEPWHIEATAP